MNCSKRRVRVTDRSRLAAMLLLSWSLVIPPGSIGLLAKAEVGIFKDMPYLAGLQKKISLDLRQMDILEVLKFLALQGDLNIVPTKTVGGRVTLTLNDIRLQDALDLIMLTNELAYVQEGPIIRVMTEGDYQRIYGDPFADRRQVQQFHLKHANVNDVAAILGNLKSGVGKIITDPATGTLILIEVPDKLAQMAAMALNFDRLAIQPQDTHVFELKYGKVDVVKTEVEKVLTPKIGTLRADKRTNTLIVSDLPLRMQQIQQVVAAFDRKTREVIIEAKIIQIHLNDELRTGVDWAAVFRTIGGINQLKVENTVLQAGATQGAKVTIATTIGQDSVSAVLQFLQTLGTTDLLSTPQLAVIENEEAKILVGAREAFVTSVVTQTAQASTTAEQLTFVDVGIQLKVSPVINQDGYVTMKIRPEVSTVSRSITTALGNVVPIVETSTAESTVMVRNGHTIVIAGLIRDVKVINERRVPILGSIPLLGFFFRSRQDSTVRAEIVFFLTPKVVEGLEETASASPAPSSLRTPGLITPASPLILAPLGRGEREKGNGDSEGQMGEGRMGQAGEQKKPVLDVLKRLDKVLESMREIVGESTATQRKGGE